MLLSELLKSLWPVLNYIRVYVMNIYICLYLFNIYTYVWFYCHDEVGRREDIISFCFNTIPACGHLWNLNSIKIWFIILYGFNENKCLNVSSRFLRGDLKQFLLTLFFFCLFVCYKYIFNDTDSGLASNATFVHV